MSAAELEAVNDLLRAMRAGGGFRSGDWPAKREAMKAGLSSFPIAPGTAMTPVDANGVPAEWTSQGAKPGPGVILYFHGGGYCLGGIDTHRSLVSTIAARFGGRALSVEYRLAPEHKCPAAIEDAVKAYRFLLAQGVAPAEIVLAGDSAGGGLTVAALVAIRDAGLPRPAGGWCLSPWVDLTGHSETMRTKAETDHIVGREGLLESADAYAPGGDRADPRASPVFADLTGLPPLLIQVGTAETLLDDAAELARAASEADVEVRYEAWPGMPHVWHVFAPMLEEARDAIDAGARWCAAKTGGAQA